MTSIQPESSDNNPFTTSLNDSLPTKVAGPNPRVAATEEELTFPRVMAIGSLLFVALFALVLGLAMHASTGVDHRNSIPRQTIDHVVATGMDVSGVCLVFAAFGVIRGRLAFARKMSATGIAIFCVMVVVMMIVHSIS
ncbi:hypothetical protein Poly51_08480 [Rubripirellula tenax]|uniref:Uncharacterized protein n=1 Tax=Rubripirellula tenax TaxID=2528015 RepID=A0A5C6FGB1_9BACT|nr:hypothetical protein [Rubripirellula tenax]TWU60571.1 hypothetical protein Poly51_08480 [Rubripirellula tenax]